MSDETIPFAEPMPVPPGTSRDVGERVDAGRGRIFPCEQCGADLVFSVGLQSLQCPYCQHVQHLQPEDRQIVEQDFEAMLVKLQEWRASGKEDQQTSEVRCESCGGNVVFTGTLTSSTCPYCASPIQRENVHNSPQRVPVDAVLPFRVDQKTAIAQVEKWVESLWFAPSDFKSKGVRDRLAGVYLPYWTYDSMTFNRYDGERGDHYYVTVGTGKNRRTERRTRWTPAAGEFQRFFDDVLVLAGARIPSWMSVRLEPWPLAQCVPFTPEVLAGFLAQTYDVPLDKGFVEAKTRIEAAIAADVRTRIGGDEQRVHQIQTWYSAITYKHLILPTWLLAYRYNDKVYQIAVNAGTGEVQGERPYSWIKITFAVLAAVAAVAAVAIGVHLSQGH